MGDNKMSNQNAQPPPPRKGYPNPPEKGIPDAATLRDQMSYARRQYLRWYSNAWGAFILAGVSFYALGWVIKGSNPISSLSSSNNANNNNTTGSNSDDDKPSKS